ncbi:MAG: sigma-70 family RNA polymerase sigma factor [Verrucomicrobiales bacterium]|nr:sigma-70 family RNA polymerase sigma factor [Verrucomicrobiales bacterium]
MATDRSTLFLTTNWTLVSEAARTGDTQARAALGELFGVYWKPLYRFARRQGHGPEDAEDLVQGFFAHLLEGGGLRLADRERGRFRAFMLGALRNFMANEWRREHRQKRGGFTPHLSLDRQGAETGLRLDAEDARSPDRLFDREWAVALLDGVLDDLEREEPGFKQWKPFLSLSRERLSYAEMAQTFGMTEGAARVAVHRLRKRYRQRVRDAIAATLTDASMVEEEMQALFAALAEDCS